MSHHPPCGTTAVGRGRFSRDPPEATVVIVAVVAKLDAADRAKLPDTAFAYIDSKGTRRLPIYDESHVRNALSRFNQVAFEDDRARDRARKRLLAAAKKFGIVPLGFIDGQFRSERELAELRGPAPIELPSGFLTLLMTDIEGSTGLVDRLGDRYGALLDDIRAQLRGAATRFDGYVVEERADEFFAVFVSPRAGLETALAIQRDFRTRAWAHGGDVRVRIGLHSGYPTLAEVNYIGMPVHLAARICAAAHGGQIVVSADMRTASKGAVPEGVRFKSLGLHRLHGIRDEVPLFQVAAKGLVASFPALRVTVPGRKTSS
jgi:class 3 adenylate cyclase